MLIDDCAEQTIGENERAGSSPGVAMIEFAVVITLFVIIVFNIVSFGPFFDVYLSTTHLAHECTRMLSNQADLTSGVTVTSVWQMGGTASTVCHRDQSWAGTYPGCDSSIVTIPDSHRTIHDRVLPLIDAVDIEKVLVNNQVGVTTSYDFANDSVTCTIFGQYQGWAGLLLGTVVVTEEGPFLY